MAEIKEAEVIEVNKPEKKKKQKKGIKNAVERLTTNISIGSLIVKSVLMIVIPYVYLFICGFIDSALLKAGFAYREIFILFVFFTLMIAWIAAIVLIVISSIKYRKSKKQ